MITIITSIITSIINIIIIIMCIMCIMFVICIIVIINSSIVVVLLLLLSLLSVVVVVIVVLGAAPVGEGRDARPDILRRGAEHSEDPVEPRRSRGQVEEKTRGSSDPGWSSRECRVSFRATSLASSNMY